MLFSLLEEAYTKNPYYVPIMDKELSTVKQTLQFMVEKEGKKWLDSFVGEFGKGECNPPLLE